MKGLFSLLDGHEQVVHAADRASGLRCIIAVHSTALGPSLGGTRFRPYASEEDALVDVLRLSRAMSYKAACAGLDLGGGKAVIIGDPARDKTEALLRAYGRVVESLGGRYITACDVGTYPGDMEVVARESRWVTGMDEVAGGSGDSGVTTAYGVFVALQALAEFLWGEANLNGRRVAVQGLGKVGARLTRHLVEAGAKVSVTDVDPQLVGRVAASHSVAAVAPDEIYDVEADIFSPNALGAVLNETTIPRLRVAAVCGGANNQLATAEDATRLREREIVYAPDYVVNSGGLIQVADELHPGGYSPQRALRKTGEIGHTLRTILARAERSGTTTEEAARQIAERRMEEVSRLRRFHLGASR